MAGYITINGKNTIANAIITELSSTAKIALFTNTINDIDQETVLSDLDKVTGTSYADQTISTWTVLTDVNNIIYIQGSTVTFTPGGSWSNVNSYGIIFNDELLSVSMLPEAAQGNKILGDSITITPKIDIMNIVE